MRESLLEIGIRLQSSKYSGHSYLPVYDELFAPLRDEPITLVEFGIGDANSMMLWLLYFSKAKIIGIDEGQDNVHKGNTLDPRCTCYHYRQEDGRVSHLAVMQAGMVNIVIDDAGHVQEHTHACFEYNARAVVPGGYWIVEDVPHEDCLPAWQSRAAAFGFDFTVHANHKTGFGDYRDDDILVVMRRAA